MTEQQSDDLYIPTFFLRYPLTKGPMGVPRKMLKTSSKMFQAGLNISLRMKTTSG